MPRKKIQAHEVRLQQLRSFCETARLGSLTAAAQSLRLTQPTIGEQVHSLERDLNELLVEPHGRGCRLTEAGRILAELAGPLVAGIDSLKSGFHEACKKQRAQITVASSPRVLAEDIIDCVPEFERRYPQAQLTCIEMHNEAVIEAVQSGRADLGITLAAVLDRNSPWVEIEDGYLLDVLLIAPRNHPLAQRPGFALADAAEYPVVNAPWSMGDPAVTKALQKLGLLVQRRSKVQAVYSAAIRRFVERGLGIGFVFGIGAQAVGEAVFERSISDQVGHVRIDFVWRRGTIRSPLARGFADVLKESMAAKRSTAAPHSGQRS